MHYRPMNPRDELIKEINAFLKATGMSPSTFGYEAIGDRALIFTLNRGRDLKGGTIAKLRKYMAEERAKPRPKKAA